MVIGDGDLFILLGFQLALVETQGTFQNVFDLISKKRKINKKDKWVCFSKLAKPLIFLN